MLRGLVAWAFGLALALPAAAGPIGDSLGLNPYWHWREIRTEHFTVTFPEELAPLAPRTAGYLEEAHRRLAPFLHWSPAARTQVLLIDNSDAANGLTSAFLRLGMILYLTPPEPQFSTQYYDDWLRLLAFHEYTHFLNMDAAEDFYRVLRVLFGDVFLPNIAWPTWMLEGLAVYVETRFTAAGRGRSPEYGRIVRAAAEAGVLDDPSFITLDELNGERPYHPGGETPYLFGYFLMEEAARTRTADGLSADRRSKLEAPEDALGDLSIRSASRFPFFINGNLENVIGQDWPAVWQNWVGRAHARAADELRALRAKPLSKVTPLTEPGLQDAGLAISPDGTRVFFTRETPDRIAHLWTARIGPEKLEEEREVEKKLLGGALSFTPDGGTLLYSGYRKLVPYRFFSDLRAYDLARDQAYWLTDGARARDPDLSPDGTQVAFTQAGGGHPPGSVGLSLAPVHRRGDGRLELGPPAPVPGIAPLDRVSTPKFSRDGRTVYFAWHRNGRRSVEIAAWDLAARRLSVALDNGAFNRDLTVTPQGDLEFVSDLGGVENAYRLEKSGAFRRVAAVTTGAHFPTRAPDGRLHALVYTNRGWQMSRLTETAEATQGPAPAAPPPEPPAPEGAPESYEVHDYSAWRSLLPRQWLALPLLFPGGVSITGQASGFDAVDRHSYALGLGYTTSIPFLDASALYSNRSFGPTLSLGARTVTESYALSSSALYPGIQSFVRRDELSVTASFPVLWTFSSLVPVAGFEAIRDSYYRYLPGQDDVTRYYTGALVPSTDFAFYSSSALAPRLAVAPEQGRAAFAGARAYFDGGRTYFKASARDQEYFHLGRHFVLSPSAQIQWVSGQNPSSLGVNAVVEGRSPSILFDPQRAAFDSMRARGYAGQAYFARAAAQLALDLRLPILRIFRGWSTNPVFLDQLYGLAFTEATWLGASDFSWNGWLPSAGLGLRLSAEMLLKFPLTLSAEYHQGLRAEAGGRADLYLQILLNSFQF